MPIPARLDPGTQLIIIPSHDSEIKPSGMRGLERGATLDRLLGRGLCIWGVQSWGFWLQAAVCIGQPAGGWCSRADSASCQIAVTTPLASSRPKPSIHTSCGGILRASWQSAFETWPFSFRNFWPNQRNNAHVEPVWYPRKSLSNFRFHAARATRIHSSFDFVGFGICHGVRQKCSTFRVAA